jgi:hypothetical protein
MPFTLRAHRRAIGLAVAALAALAALAMQPSRSQAAASCTAGPTRTHDGRTYHTRYCPNIAGVHIYEIFSNGKIGRKLDEMETTRSWFACQQRFPNTPNPKLGSGHNHYWLWTEGDVDHTWGWFPANGVTIGGQEAPIPGVPIC